MTELAILLAAGTIAAGVVLAVVLRHLPAVRWQLAGLALLAVVLPLGAVLGSGWVMFEKSGDTQTLAVSSAAALSAVLAALLLARWIRQPLDRLRETTTRLAAGDLAARAREDGPAELAEMARSFNAMADSIERLFEARRELVSWASHDLRSPLTSMRMMLDAIEDGLAEPSEYLPLLGDRLGTLTSLVDDLFELTRVDAGVLTLQLQRVDVDELVSSCVRGFQPEADARRVALCGPASAGQPAVLCSPEKVERVLHNLLTNALRHTPADGAIAVTLDHDDRAVTVAVEDTGDGLTREAQARMFEQFWRADTARASDGSGLGLAIARALVEAQGGRIWSESRASGGARVAFTLPVAGA